MNPARPKELLEELRSGNEWVRRMTEGIDSSAAHAIPQSVKKYRCAFLVLDSEKKVPLSPFQFHQTDDRVLFHTFSSSDEARKAPLEPLFASQTDMIVVMGVLNSSTSDTSLWAWLKNLVSQKWNPLEERIVKWRKSLLGLEEMTQEVRRRVHSRGLRTPVVQAAFDAEKRVAYWDLERAFVQSHVENHALRPID